MRRYDEGIGDNLEVLSSRSRTIEWPLAATAMASALGCGRSEKKSRRMVSVSGGEKSVMPTKYCLESGWPQ
jgi:hypothetical protein